MKKLCALLVTAVLLFPAMGATALAAGSASVSISNYTSVQQGRSYTYTISVRITSSMDFIGSIKFSGIFSHSDINLDFHPSSNSSKTLTNKVTLKIPSNAALGSTGKITVTGEGSYYINDYDMKEYHVSKSLTAKVVAYVPSTKKPSPTKTPSPAPTATPVPTEWDAAARSVAALETGGTLSVDVQSSPKIPAALLSALKEKRGKLTVNMSNCTCTIDGAALGGIPAADALDLSMSMDKDPALSAAAGGADVYQLHFAGSGQLPGRFIYSFKAESNKPGDTLYLYYYYGQSGVMEGVQSAVVDGNGYVTFEIYHCSSYFVAGSVLQDAAGIRADAAGGRQGVQEAQEPQDAQPGPADLEAQLKAAQDSATQLDDQIKQQESRLKAAQDDVAALKAEAEGKLGVTPTVLILTVCGAALLAMFLTMLFCRAGLFRSRQSKKIDAGANEDL